MEPIKLIALHAGHAETWSHGCEQHAVHLTYDISPYLSLWPDAIPAVAFERADGTRYAHTWVLEGTLLRIPLLSADTEKPGICKCFISLKSGDGQANTVVFYGNVTEGIDTLGNAPTAPAQGVIEQVNAAAVRAEIAAGVATGTLESIEDAGNAQLEKIKNSTVTKEAISQAVEDWLNENGVSAEQVGAPTAEAFQAHTENTSNPHGVTAQQAGAAPAGYGLGTDAAIRVDDLSANGYIATPNTPSGAWAWGQQIHLNYLSATQILCDTNGYIMVRTLANGVWQPWEWINPSMVLNVEYRTTERWNGKAVYTQLINCGELAVGVKDVVTTVPVDATIIRYEAFYTTTAGSVIDNPAVDYATSDTIARLTFNGSRNIVIVTYGDGLSGTAVCQVWYTKS